ncbi:MAG TPA: DUF397 domain-containing protein [Catenuloplanes sp.]|jgi:hypothetical protein
MKRNEWVKASRSGNNGQCVEAKDTGPTVDVRDSKDKDGPVLTFSAEDWSSFVYGLKDGAFDLPA